tara:strand:- start:587 stop:913 length:327 start_codon:yes stop_codon:yes gene_type:complete
MPEKKKNEMKVPDGCISPDGKVSRESAAMSALFDSKQENLLLKGGRTHRLSIGGVTLEIVPSSNLSPQQVFNMYVKFIKELKELHGDKHLSAMPQPASQENGLGGLFG